MLRLLDRYLFKEILSPFLVGVLILTFLILLQQLLILTEWVVTKGISLVTVTEIFIKILPSFFLLTIPMAVTFASILAFHRLSSDRELIALSAAGIGFFKMLKPVMVFAIFAALLTFLMGTLAATWETGSLKSVGKKMLKERIGIGLDAGRFTEIFPGLMIYADSMPNATEIEHVFIYDGRSSQMPQIIAAKKGRLINEKDSIGLSLEEGRIHLHKDQVDQTISFSSYIIKMSMPLLSSSPAKNEDQSRQQMARHKTVAFATASFLLCLTGAAFGGMTRTGGRFGPIVSGIALILFYYSLQNVGNYFFPFNSRFPEIAVWTPNMILIPVTFFLLFQRCKKKI
ncbi:MAG: LptF/LptG family permease [Nitrospirota bacterium]